MQTAENRVGLPQNLLYDVLRRREARLSHAGAGSLWSLAALALAAPLALVGAVWAPLAAATGRAGTLTVYARKERNPDPRP